VTHIITYDVYNCVNIKSFSMGRRKQKQLTAGESFTNAVAFIC